MLKASSPFTSFGEEESSIESGCEISLPTTVRFPKRELGERRFGTQRGGGAGTDSVTSQEIASPQFTGNSHGLEPRKRLQREFRMLKQKCQMTSDLSLFFCNIT